MQTHASLCPCYAHKCIGRFFAGYVAIILVRVVTLSQSGPLRVVCACAHVYGAITSSYFSFFFFFFSFFCHVASQKQKRHPILFLHGLLSNTLPFLNFYLCISATIYAHVLILAMQCTKVFFLSCY